MELILISAMSRTRVIGKGDGLPWQLPQEYAHFLAQVRGHPILLGRRSYEIFGPDLTESPLLVVSRSLQLPAGDRARACPSLESALQQAATLGERVFVGGGAGIYAQTLPLASALYLSVVEGDYSGDTYFPEIDEQRWCITRRVAHPGFEFRVYQRR